MQKKHYLQEQHYFIDTYDSQANMGKRGKHVYSSLPLPLLTNTEISICSYTHQISTSCFKSQYMLLPDCYSMRFIHLWELALD